MSNAPSHIFLTILVLHLATLCHIAKVVCKYPPSLRVSDSTLFVQPQREEVDYVEEVETSVSTCIHVATSLTILTITRAEIAIIWKLLQFSRSDCCCSKNAMGAAN